MRECRKGACGLGPAMMVMLRRSLDAMLTTPKSALLVAGGGPGEGAERQASAGQAPGGTGTGGEILGSALMVGGTGDGKPIARAGACESIVRALIAAKAYVDAQDGFHSTPLHLAAERGREAAVQLLLGAGANTHVRNVFRQTAADVTTSHVIRWMILQKNAAELSHGEAGGEEQEQLGQQQQQARAGAAGAELEQAGGKGRDEAECNEVAGAAREGGAGVVAHHESAVRQPPESTQEGKTSRARHDHQKHQKDHRQTEHTQPSKPAADPLGLS
eukprot:Tamp_13115.p1 GENE.Tamp_13115~~Tamp_13115.p1  ORF type:complete len:274 (-),score=45.53 Tamp_13115:125-946(-)